MMQPPPTAPDRPPARPWLRYAGHVLAVVFLAYLGWVFSRHARQVVLDLTLFSTWVGLGLSLAVYLGALFAFGIAWHLVLKSQGSPAGPRTALVVFSVSQAAKYVPGNVAHHIGRIALSVRHGIPAAVAVPSLLFELVGVLLVTALVALGGLLGGEPGGLPGESSVPPRWRVGFLAAAAAAALALGLLLVRRWPRPSGHAPPRSLWSASGLYLLSLCLYGLIFLLHGLALGVLAHQAFGTPPVPLLRLTALFALAWVSGFLTPGAPAGLGVRELVLVVLLRPLYGEATAVNLALALRVVHLTGDLLALLAGLGLRRSLKPTPAGGTQGAGATPLS